MSREIEMPWGPGGLGGRALMEAMAALDDRASASLSTARFRCGLRVGGAVATMFDHDIRPLMSFRSEPDGSMSPMLMGVSIEFTEEPAMAGRLVLEVE